MASADDSTRDSRRRVLESRAEGTSFALVRMTVTAFFPTLLILSFGGGVGVSSHINASRHLSPRATWICDVLLALWLLFDLPYLIRLWKFIFTDRSIAPSIRVAEIYRPWWPLRPIAAVWWAAHFAMGALMAYRFENISIGGDPLSDRVVLIIVFSFFCIGFSYCANGFLLMAIASVTSKQSGCGVGDC